MTLTDIHRHVRGSLPGFLCRRLRFVLHRLAVHLLFLLADNFIQAGWNAHGPHYATFLPLPSLPELLYGSARPCRLWYLIAILSNGGRCASRPFYLPSRSSDLQPAPHCLNTFIFPIYPSLKLRWPPLRGGSFLSLPESQVRGTSPALDICNFERLGIPAISR